MKKTEDEIDEELRAYAKGLLDKRLISAARNGNREGILDALRDGADPNAIVDGELALGLAAQSGKAMAVREMLKSGADPRREGARKQTALHSLARAPGQVSEERLRKVARILIEAGADVSAEDNGGWGPLAVALRNRRKDLAMDLIAAGAKASGVDQIGRTLEQIAKECGLSEERSLARMLIEAESLEKRTPSLERARRKRSPI